MLASSEGLDQCLPGGMVHGHGVASSLGGGAQLKRNKMQGKAQWAAFAGRTPLARTLEEGRPGWPGMCAHCVHIHALRVMS